VAQRKQKSEGMVDVGNKKITLRTAIASATIRMSQKTFQTLIHDGSPKGDVFQTAKIAGIMAAKSTSQIIPLCHPLELNKVEILFQNNSDQSVVVVTGEVRARSRTGVEMEALTAVSAAALTIYDMMKWKDKGIEISQIYLLKKTGGKGGPYQRRV